MFHGMSAPGVVAYELESHPAIKFLSLRITGVYEQSYSRQPHALGLFDNGIEQYGCHALATAVFRYGYAVDIQLARPSLVSYIAEVAAEVVIHGLDKSLAQVVPDVRRRKTRTYRKLRRPRL